MNFSVGLRRSHGCQTPSLAQTSSREAPPEEVEIGSAVAQVNDNPKVAYS
jgi:hypothetical protein